MLKILLLALISGLTFSTSFAQSGAPHDMLIRFNFPGLIDFQDNNLSSGLEYKINQQWSTGADVGWIFSSRYMARTKAANGLLFRPFIRLYPKENGKLFVETELHYKKVTYKIEDWLGRSPVNGTPAYEEFTTFNYKKRAMGMHFRVGGVFDITKDGLLKLEMTGGIGFRYKEEYPVGGLYQSGRPFFLRGGDDNGGKISTSLPVFPFNLRLCYQVN